MTKVVPYAPIVSLGEERVNRIREMMIGGESISNIVRTIQSEWQSLTDMTEVALHKMLSRYRMSQVKPAQKQEIAQIIEAKKAPALRKSLNAINELEDAVALQAVRVKKWLAQESQMSLPIKDAREDLRLLKDMLRDLGMLQLETGILKRAPKTTLGQFFGVDGQAGAFVLTEAWEQAMQELDLEELGEVIDVDPE